MSVHEARAVAASKVFDGSALHEDHAVLFEGHRILGLAPRHAVPPGMPVDELPCGAWLAPGFIDVQVNGGGDVLFNNDPSPEALLTILAAHRRFGTTSMLPTLITDRPEIMDRALRAVQSVLGKEPGILGIHLEGPFLSPERAGVHRPDFIRTPSLQDLERLTSLVGGTTLVTLAPEQAPAGFVAELARRGAKIALGHSMATYAETRQALAEGLSGFTHLFNAMRPVASREPGPIGAALETPDCWYGLIADGKHVHAAMLRLALRGLGRPMLVTDAMAPVGGRGQSSSCTMRRLPLRTVAAFAATAPLPEQRSIWRARFATASACWERRSSRRSPWRRRIRLTSWAWAARSGGSRPGFAPTWSHLSPRASVFSRRGSPGLSKSTPEAVQRKKPRASGAFVEQGM